MRGTVKPYVRGEVLTLYAIRRGKASKQVRRAVGRRGRYEFRFKVGNPGPVRLVVKHRRERRPGGLPHARRDDPGGRVGARAPAPAARRSRCSSAAS